MSSIETTTSSQHAMNPRFSAAKAETGSVSRLAPHTRPAENTSPRRTTKAGNRVLR